MSFSREIELLPRNELSQIPLSTDWRHAGRNTAAIELFLLLGGFEWCLWTDSRQVFPKPVRLASTIALILLVLILLIRQRPSLREAGIAPPRWFGGIWSLTLFTLGGMALIVGCGWYLGTIGQVDGWLTWIRKNWHLEGVQQLLLQVLLVPRLAILMGRRGLGVSIVAGTIFSLLHAPNPMLMGLTLIAGVAWCEWFRRYENLLALWVSHLLLAATALYCLNGPSLGMLRVGIGYVYRNY